MAMDLIRNIEMRLMSKVKMVFLEGARTILECQAKCFESFFVYKVFLSIEEFRWYVTFIGFQLNIGRRFEIYKYFKPKYLRIY